MPKIVAWQSSYTGEVFTSEKKYLAHNRSQAALKRKNDEKQAIKDEFMCWLRKEQAALCDIALLPEWIMENQRRLMIAYNSIPEYRSWQCDVFYDTDVIASIELDVRWNKSVSNTHSCPAGGVMNFRCVGDLPSGYPGWHGKVSGALLRKKDHDGYPMSGLLKMVGVHTGSGGGGNNAWKYEARVYAQDWVGAEQALTYSAMMGA